MLAKLFNILCCVFFACTTLIFTPQVIADTISYSVENVPNPRLQDRFLHVSDPSTLLSDNTVTYINKKLISLENQQGIQSAVVMLPSIGKKDAFEFSQELFRSWGIGSKSKNDGLLVLYIDDQHYIRFHTGYGLEGSLPDAICKRIQMQNMIPYFKQGKIDDGMKAGIDAICLRLNDPQNTTIDDIPKEDDDDFELFLYVTLGTICVILLSAGGVIFHNLNRKCPHCGKRRTLKTINQEEVSGVKHKWMYITKKCSNCGYETVIKYDISGRGSSFNDHDSSNFGGSSGGGSGGSYGGGSSGGGGAGSHW